MTNKTEILRDFGLAVVKKDRVLERFDKISELIEKDSTPEDIIDIVDYLEKQDIPMPELKMGINKMLNLFYRSINDYPYKEPKKDTFLWYLVQNNTILDKKLKAIKTLIKQINKNIESKIINKLIEEFTEIQKFTDIYIIKENILFPVIEKHLKKYRCVKIMWSFHDDIRNNLKTLLDLLKKEDIDMSIFNRVSAEIFFNMLAIKFRDDKILFPIIEKIIPQQQFEIMLKESADFNFPFVKPRFDKIEIQKAKMTDNIVELPTGTLSPEQIALIFNHLPVDITYVDENNKVKYFSQPKSRIFPRTIAVIGRDVKNCHPPESVHIVEKIVEKFKSGEKDEAVFWFTFKDKFLVIKYFAVRDDENNYRGVLEVSQEVNDIKDMKGQNRLLDWK